MKVILTAVDDHGEMSTSILVKDEDRLIELVSELVRRKREVSSLPTDMFEWRRLIITDDDKIQELKS